MLFNFEKRAPSKPYFPEYNIAEATPPWRWSVVVSRLSQDMLDLHCHILPGIDDGPASLDEAMAMARFCARDGITHIIATPHCHRHLRLLRSDILPHVARFNEELSKARTPLTVLPGSEVQRALRSCRPAGRGVPVRANFHSRPRPRRIRRAAARREAA
jgi:hypothetical protein